MNNNKGIGFKLYLLIISMMILIIGISSFSWFTFKNFDKKIQERLHTTSVYSNLVDHSRGAQVDFKKQVQEWKNILLRGNDLESFNKYSSKFSEENNKVQSDLKELKAHMIEKDMDTSLIDSLIISHNELFIKYNNALENYDSQNPQSYEIVDNLVKGIDRKPTDDMDLLVKQIQDKAQLETNNIVAQSKKDTDIFKRNIILIAIISIIIILILSTMILLTYKDITKFIKQFQTLISKAEDGDLTVRGEIYKKDELGTLTESFNGFLVKIGALIYEATTTSSAVSSSSEDIMNSSNLVNKVAEELSGTISNMAEDAIKQTEFAQESNASIKGIVKGLNSITESTSYIKEMSNKAVDTVNSGVNNLKYQNERMLDSSNASHNVESVITDLSTKSSEIGQVVEFINGITEQINLLALNASIEAARAGEAGRGFTVVANEVKNLANLSRESTQQISNLINEVQVDIEKAVAEVANTNSSIEKQKSSLKITEDSFKKIQDSVLDLGNKINDVSNEANIINNNAVSIEKSIESITNIIKENALSTQEAASATEEQAASIETIVSSINHLTEQSNNLQETISKFQV